MGIIRDTLQLRLRLARESVGLRQWEVADKLGTTQAGYNRWETGQRGVSSANLKVLADLYGTTVGWLMGELPLFEPSELVGATPQEQL